MQLAQQGIILSSSNIRTHTIPSDFVLLIFEAGQSNVWRAESARMIQLSEYPEFPTQWKIYWKPSYDSSDNGSFVQPQNGIYTREPDQTAFVVGAQLPLAHLMANKFPNNPVYVVGAGDGGTALQQNLTNPDWSPISVGECFQIFTQYYYDVAYTKCAAENPGKTIVPLIIWHQGESDAANNPATAAYASNFGAFVTALRASHASLANALLVITKLNYMQTANEATINAVFDAYRSTHPYTTAVIDISDKPRKMDLTTAEKGGITPSAADDEHQSWIAQIAKADRILSAFLDYYDLTPTRTEQLSNTGYDPSVLTSSGIRLQFNKNNGTLDTYKKWTAITNNLSTGSFTTFSGTPNPLYKFDWNYKGWVSFIANASAYIESSAAIGTTLFSNAGGWSFSAWVRPRDGQAAVGQMILHDVQNTSSAANSRVGINIATTGKINVFISIGGTTVQATTANVIFSDGVQSAPKHIAVTATPGNLIRIYVDGVLQTLDAVQNGNISGLTLTSYLNNTNKLLIGGQRTTTVPNAFYMGLLRELTVQPGVIYSTTDIANLMLN